MDDEYVSALANLAMFGLTGLVSSALARSANPDADEKRIVERMYSLAAEEKAQRQLALAGSGPEQALAEQFTQTT